MGKEPGYCKGIGGTQHLCATEISFLGTNGITGGGIPIATGVGLALKLQKRKHVVLCFFGDGAANQGTFHESLNMASIWKVPIVYICENNLYAMSTSVEESMNIKDIAVRAGSYGIPSEIADGMDVINMKDTVTRAVKCAREGTSPTLIEAKTYRYCGHSKSDPRKYRTKEEEEFWRKKDPLLQFEKTLIDNGLTLLDLNSLKDKVRDTIEDAFNFAMAASYADSNEFPGEYLVNEKNNL
jgi:pyruvate dehydrogenase E1 component alpha subunit